MGMTGEQAYVLAKKLIEAGGGGGGTVDAYTKTQTDNLLNQKVDKEVGKGLFSGSYNDLSDAPTIPSKTSELQNDSGYLTEHQDLTDYAKKTELEAVENTLSNEISRAKEADETLKSRVDVFTSLPEGSTTGDAELQDIRVKADGTIAENAGNAVREQVSELKEELDDLKKEEIGKQIENVVGFMSVNKLNLHNATILIRDNAITINSNDSFIITSVEYRANVVNIVIPCEHNKYYSYRCNKNLDNATVGLRFEDTIPSTFNSEVNTTDKIFFSGNHNYVNIGFVIPQGNTITVKDFSIYEAEYDNLKTQIEVIRNELGSNVGATKLSWEDGKLYNLYNGTDQSSTQWCRSNIISCNFIPKVVYPKNFVIGDSVMYALWNNNIFVGSYSPYGNYGLGEYRDISYIAVSNPISFDSMAIMLQNANNYRGTLIINDSSLDKFIDNSNVYFENNIRIICIGDSLTQGDYGSEPMGTQNIHQENYPYFMAKYLGLNLNDDVCNAGCCGFTPKAWYEEFTDSTHYYYEKWNGYFNTDKKIIVAIMLGTNGTMGEDITTTPTTQSGAYCSIIEKVYELTDNKAEIVLLGCPWVDRTKREGNYNNVINNIPIIKSIAEKYNLPFIDIFGELGVNSITSATLQPIDGLHFGKDGYARMGTFIGSKIKSLTSFIS